MDSDYSCYDFASKLLAPKLLKFGIYRENIHAELKSKIVKMPENYKIGNLELNCTTIMKIRPYLWKWQIDKIYCWLAKRKRSNGITNLEYATIRTKNCCGQNKRMINRTFICVTKKYNILKSFRIFLRICL